MRRSRRTRNKTKMRAKKRDRKTRMRGKMKGKTKMRGKNARKTRMHRRKYVMRGGADDSDGPLHESAHGVKEGDYAYVEPDDPGHKVKVYDVNDPDTQIRELQDGWIVQKFTIKEFNGIEGLRIIPDYAKRLYRGKTIVLWYDAKHRFYNKYGCIETKYLKDLDGDYTVGMICDDTWHCGKDSAIQRARAQDPRSTRLGETPSWVTDGLPPGWSYKYSGTGDSYYFVNDLTRERTWEKPTEAAKPLPTNWVMKRATRTGETYYLNNLTGETQWYPDIPTEAAKPLPPGWEVFRNYLGEIKYRIIGTDGPSQSQRPTGPPQHRERALEPESPETLLPPSNLSSGDPRVSISDDEGDISDDEGDIFDDGMDLPPDWNFEYTDSGEVYYVNDLTGETQWEKPTEAAKPLPPGWEVIHNESGEIRYKLTGTNRPPQSWRPT